MSRSVLVLGLIVLAVGAFVGRELVATQRRALAREARLQAIRDAAREDSLGAIEAMEALKGVASKAGVHGGIRPPRWMQAVQAQRLARPLDAPVRDAADADRWRQYARLGYLAETAQENEGLLARWPGREEPLRVWVQPAPKLPLFRSEYAGMARAALRTWTEAGLGIGLVPVADSTDADIFVLWRHQLQGSRIGETLRMTDAHGWIVAAVIVVGLEDYQKRPLDVYTIQNVVRHELGHALGIDHSPVSDDIMFASAGRHDRLSSRDVATLRLLYALPPGPVPR